MIAAMPPNVRPSAGRRARLRVVPAIALGLSFSLLAMPAAVLGHDERTSQGVPALDLQRALTSWAFDPLVWVAVLVGVAGYVAAVRSVNRAHPSSRVPPRRIAAWVSGLGVIFVALQSSLDVYATTLFSVHMVQHLLLAMVAAPLLALGAPVTLLLRAARGYVRRRYLLPVLHSRPLRLLAFPVLTWLLFTGVMWVSHFSPLFNAALEEPLVHQFEHALFLGSAMLFWWPVVGADPAPWRMGHAARLGYLFLQMPQNSFLGLALLSAGTVLYPHYATVERSWGPSPLDDQRLAAGIMWGAGDLLFVLALVLVAVAWLRAEEADAERADARLDRLRESQRAATSAPERP